MEEAHLLSRYMIDALKDMSQYHNTIATMSQNSIAALATTYMEGQWTSLQTNNTNRSRQEMNRERNRDTSVRGGPRSTSRRATGARDARASRVDSTLRSNRFRRKRRRRRNNSRTPPRDCPSQQDSRGLRKRSPSTEVVPKQNAEIHTETVQSGDGIDVAVTTSPRAFLTEDQVTVIKENIEELAFTELDKNISEDTAFVPTFAGKPQYNNGVLMLTVSDIWTLTWLQGVVGRLGSPVPNTILVAVRQQELNNRVKAGILIPNTRRNMDGNTIMRYLGVQNRESVHGGLELGVSSWSLYSHERQGDNDFIVVGIPQIFVPNLMKRNKRLYYNIGNVYVRFFGENGRFSDTPPLPEEGTAITEGAGREAEIQSNSCASTSLHSISLSMPSSYITWTPLAGQAESQQNLYPMQFGQTLPENNVKDYMRGYNTLTYNNPMSSDASSSSSRQEAWDPEMQRQRETVRQLHNRAVTTHRESDWDKHREAQQVYKREARSRKRRPM